MTVRGGRRLRKDPFSTRFRARSDHRPHGDRRRPLALRSRDGDEARERVAPARHLRALRDRRRRARGRAHPERRCRRQRAPAAGVHGARPRARVALAGGAPARVPGVSRAGPTAHARRAATMDFSLWCNGLSAITPPSAAEWTRAESQCARVLSESNCAELHTLFAGGVTTTRSTRFCEPARGFAVTTPPARASATLDCPVAREADRTLWLDLCSKLLRWRAPPSLVWHEAAASKVLVALGPIPVTGLTYLTQPDARDDRLWPLRASRPEAALCRVGAAGRGGQARGSISPRRRSRRSCRSRRRSDFRSTAVRGRSDGGVMGPRGRSKPSPSARCMSTRVASITAGRSTSVTFRSRGSANGNDAPAHASGRHSM